MKLRALEIYFNSVSAISENVDTIRSKVIDKHAPLAPTKARPGNDFWMTQHIATAKRTKRVWHKHKKYKHKAVHYSVKFYFIQKTVLFR